MAVPIEKEITGIDKNEENFTKDISFILQIIDGTRFMASSLSNIFNNLSEGIRRTKCKYGHGDTKCKTCGLKYKYWNCFLECTNLKF